MREKTFNNFYLLYPEKFTNITNGVTLRRWLGIANPMLSSLYTSKLECSEWLKNPSMLKELVPLLDDSEFIIECKRIKQHNKELLANYLRANFDFEIDSNSLLDVMVKRIHEYKRQQMLLCYCIYNYIYLTEKAINNPEDIVPRTILIAGKAASGYKEAKDIIEAFNLVSDVVNSDQIVSKFFKIFFVPDYSVSLAEKIVAASDISEHISCAGFEASGTSNMKFVINGGVIIGTHDGANIEISEAIGSQNTLLFGLKADEVQFLQATYAQDTNIPQKSIPEELRKVADLIYKHEVLSKCDALIRTIEKILTEKKYMVAEDFVSYISTQLHVIELVLI